MKRISVFLTIVVALLFVGCRQQPSEVEYFPFCSEKNGFWGMMSPDGDVLVDGRFMYPPVYASRGVFLAQEDPDAFGFYKTNKKVERINSDRYVEAQPFRYDNYTAVRREGDNYFTIIDIEGNRVSVLPDSIIDIGLFAHGVAPFMVDHVVPRMGYVDYQGRVVIEPRYNFATNFRCGVALVEGVSDGDHHISVINPLGDVIYNIDSRYTPIHAEYSDNLLAVVNDSRQIGFLDTQGRMVIAPGDKFKYAVSHNPATIPYKFKAGRAIYTDGFHYGLIDTRGRIVVPAQYVNIYLGEGGMFVAENKEHNWGCIDGNGEVIIPFEHLPGVIRQSVTPHAIIMQNEAQRYRIINHKGEVISRPFENYQIQK